ncbi:hypothetical protein VII00023_16624 [Vibrio ichthyoenteri ATCC 700023]|uniref:Cytochrome P460 domain-containing protein n=1 Tax=Vibrio ichthyoenteri ATCC 700023 TaxID=870968 RepID=F9RZ68_9VIBR|nr:hypothetical protein [Vibrio ichthyoenteri]EGU45951.1 hypothetical protein VII00023_16624 [Vibrio ichthyoenteri ATCC 700023]
MRALGLLSFLYILLLSSFVKAESIASYPVGWEFWPIVKETIIYPENSDLPAESSLFAQETFRAYSWINNGQGSSLTIRVNPKKIKQYLNRGPYSDGPTVVAISEQADLIRITEHIGGEAIYGSYNHKGEDISHSHPSLKPGYCNSCHSSYKDICRHGVCSVFGSRLKK